MGLSAMAGFLFFVIENLTFFEWVKNTGCKTSFFTAGIPGNTLKNYYNWCNETGLRIDDERIRRYMRAVRIMQASILLLIGTVVFGGFVTSS